MKLAVDRIEDEYVVCINKETHEVINLEKVNFPSNVKDGDSVDFTDGVVTIIPNEERKKSLRERLHRLLKKD